MKNILFWLFVMLFVGVMASPLESTEIAANENTAEEIISEDFQWTFRLWKFRYLVWQIDTLDQDAFEGKLIEALSDLKIKTHQNQSAHMEAFFIDVSIACLMVGSITVVVCLTISLFSDLRARIQESLDQFVELVREPTNSGTLISAVTTTVPETCSTGRSIPLVLVYVLVYVLSIFVLYLKVTEYAKFHFAESYLV